MARASTSWVPALSQITRGPSPRRARALAEGGGNPARSRVGQRSGLGLPLLGGCTQSWRSDCEKPGPASPGPGPSGPASLYRRRPVQGAQGAGVEVAGNPRRAAGLPRGAQMARTSSRSPSWLIFPWSPGTGGCPPYPRLVTPAAKGLEKGLGGGQSLLPGALFAGRRCGPPPGPPPIHWAT